MPCLNCHQIRLKLLILSHWRVICRFTDSGDGWVAIRQRERTVRQSAPSMESSATGKGAHAGYVSSAGRQKSHPRRRRRRMVRLPSRHEPLLSYCRRRYAVLPLVGQVDAPLLSRRPTPNSSSRLPGTPAFYSKKFVYSSDTAVSSKSCEIRLKMAELTEMWLKMLLSRLLMGPNRSWVL